SAARADESGGVRIVHHDQGAVALRQVANLPELGDRAVHREYAIGGDQAHTRVLRIPQRPFELVHVVVRVAQAARLAEPYTVDDAGVIERVADDRVLRIEQRFEQAAVRIETGRI